MKFSIIVPARNARKTITRCVSSLLKQNVTDKEILLIDDHSEDGTAEICRRMAEDYPEVLFFTSAGRGVSAARNAGLKYAAGDVIGFCDSDDAYEPYTLELVRRTFLSANADAVVGGFKRARDSEEGLQTVRIFTFPSDRICSFADLMDFTFTHNKAIMGSCCNKFFKREMLESVRFDETLTHCEDMHFVFQILSRHKDAVCAIIAKPLYNYSVASPYSSATRPENLSALFRADGTSQYILSFQAIERDCSLSDRQRKYLKDLKTLFAIDGLWKLRCYRGPIYEKQIALIRSGFPAFLYGRPFYAKIKGIAELFFWRMWRMRALPPGRKRE